MEVVLAHADGHVIPVRLDHLHLRRLEHMQMSAEFGQQARPFFARGACALELREQAGEQCLTLFGIGLGMSRPDARQRAAKPFLIERLEQVIDGADLEGFEGIGVISGHEDQGGQLRRFEGTRNFNAVQGIHLDVEEDELGLLRADCFKRGGAVAIFSDHPQIALGLAILAQGAAARLLVIDDDDIHHAVANAGARRVTGPGECWIAGMVISLHHSPSAPEVAKLARPSN